MNFNSFGDILYFFRKKMGFTQEEICKGICNRRTYMKWEINQLLPSFYYMECLSYKLNIDLISYYKLFQCHKSSIFMHYDIVIRNLIKDKCYHSIKTLIPDLEKLDVKPPSFEQLIYLCKSICSLDERKYELSIKYCLKSLYIEDSNPIPMYPYGRIFSNIGMTTLICLAYSYSNLNNEQKSLEIYCAALCLLDQRLVSELHFYQSHEDEKFLYQYILYNISLLYEKQALYSQAFSFIEKSFSFSNRNNCLYFLPELFQLKLKIYYALGKYKDAYESYMHAINLYQFQNKQNKLKYLKESLHTQYPFLKNKIPNSSIDICVE